MVERERGSYRYYTKYPLIVSFVERIMNMTLGTFNLLPVRQSKEIAPALIHDIIKYKEEMHNQKKKEAYDLR
jgi:hypothetical protein